MSVDQSEYLLVKSFHIVFEAMIEELIGDNDVPKGLKEQEDGKLVDHFYTYQGLISNRDENNDVYYIGDSKYYKIGSTPKNEAVYKQYTYARNVIQWNLNLFLPDDNMSEEQKRNKIDDMGRYGKVQLRRIDDKIDDITEGYNIIPNFFISANIPSNKDGTANLIYDDITTEHQTQPPISRHFTNRLYDRDTLLLSHYNVNFLFVLALYARNNAGAKEAYKAAVRQKFRKSIQEMLEKHFKFYAIQAHQGIDSQEYFRTHFKDVVGKVYSPYQNEDIFSLALDMSDPKSQELIDQLSKDFYVAPCNLGEEPSSVIERKREEVGEVIKTDNTGMFLTCIVRKSEEGEDENEDAIKLYELFSNHKAEGKTYVMLNLPMGDDISDIKYLLPIVRNTIDGYYEIEDLRFGQRTKDFADNGATISVKLPTLKIKIGKYHPFDKVYTKGIVPRMSNQIWTSQYLKEHIFDKANTYSTDETEPTIAGEPEAEYGYVELNEWDYIENDY